MKPLSESPITVAVILTHYCNLRCDFCYLKDWELANPLRVSPERLKVLLDELTQYRSIDGFEMYGGELQLLPEDYLNDCIHILRSYRPNDIEIITNLTLITDVLYEPDIQISVSYDGTAREHHDKTLRNMQRLEKPFRALLLASRDVLSQEVDVLIDKFNSCPQLTSVEIKPYSANSDNDQGVLDSEYERFVWEFIQKSHLLHAELENEKILESSLTRNKMSFNQDYIGIQPNGSFGVLDFDGEDREYVNDIPSYNAYLEWVAGEVERVLNNPTCVSCEFLGTCTSEHLRHIHREPDSCSGHRNLIRWWKDRDKIGTGEWKGYIQAYNRLQTRFSDHHVPKGGVTLVDDTALEGAVRRYILESPEELVYPVKSYINAIVYAQTLQEVYGVHPVLVLSDPDLFLGQDPYYRTIVQDRITYERIFKVLATIPNWLDYPWPQTTRRYCIEECTSTGIEALQKETFHA